MLRSQDGVSIMRSQAKAVTQRLLDRLGLHVERVGSHEDILGRPRRDLGESYKLLHELGTQPRTIIDIGAASGTPELMAAFPDARLVLVEPLAEFADQLDLIAQTRPSIVISAAAGESTGSLTFHVHPDQLEGSSALEETMGVFADGVSRTVPVVRVDEAFDRMEFPGPYLIKIDVQGAELTALEGCAGLLDSTDALCLEVSLFSFMKEAPQLADVVAKLASLGFAAWDIIPGWTRPLDGALGQVDIVFVPETSDLRADHSFATATQYKLLTGHDQ